MPRKARIDAPGALHHIIARGIERRSIFKDNTDRNDFLKRIDTILSETQTACYAWAIIPNHFTGCGEQGHRPGNRNEASANRLCGFDNRRHRRHGHLFQNRYPS